MCTDTEHHPDRVAGMPIEDRCFCDCHDAQYGEPRNSELLCEACAYEHTVDMETITRILYGG